MSKLLIYGSNGWIGHQFINLLRKNYSETINFVEGIERCNDIENIKTEIDNEKPTHIISFTSIGWFIYFLYSDAQ